MISDIRKKLKQFSFSKLHNYLLQRLSVQKDLAFGNVSVSEFIMKGFSFCPNSFKAYFGVSEYLLKKVLKEHRDGDFPRKGFRIPPPPPSQKCAKL